MVVASSADNERSQNDLHNLNTQYAGSQFNNDLGMSMKNNVKDMNAELEKLNLQRNNDISIKLHSSNSGVLFGALQTGNPQTFVDIRKDENTNDLLIVIRVDHSENAERIKEIRKKWLLDTIVIDPGHGGKDPGAVSKKGTYVYSKIVYKKLEKFL